MATRTGWQGDEVRCVSRLEAKLKAESEYEVFRHKQDAEYISDFDKEIKRLKGDSQQEIALSLAFPSSTTLYFLCSRYVLATEGK